MLRNILVCVIGLALNAQASQKLDGPPPQKVGGYQAAKVDEPIIVEAKAFVQKHLAILRTESIKEASIQIVAGTNIRLVCRVAEEEGSGMWEFRAFKSLRGRWELQLARRLGN